MTQPWLISLFLECPPNAGLHCPDNKEIESFMESVKEKSLVWHSFPFNSQNEVYDESLFEYGIWLSTQYLPSIIPDTVLIPRVMSQRDVPGMTRSLIPLLVKNNISAISIGCNSLSAPPAVPDIFRWRDPISDTEIIAMVNAGGYGEPIPEQTVMIKNYTEALMFAWNSDNRGPFEIETLLSGLEAIGEEFPNAYVHASTFDAYVNNLLQHPEIVASLPIIDQEIGDTWTYGPPSDPLKLAQFRAATRHRSDCVKSGKCVLKTGGMTPFNNFSRILLKCGEHTFGMSIGKYLTQSYYDWSNEALNTGLNDHNIDLEMIKNSWYEQRKWCIEFAMTALKMTSNSDEMELYNNIMNELEIINNPKQSLPNINDHNQWIRINASEQFTVKIMENSYLIQFNKTTGALKKLQNTMTGVEYIGAIDNDINFVHGLGLFYYTIRTEQDFINWYENNYNYGKSCNKDFCKIGLANHTNDTVKHQNIQSSLLGIYKHISDDIFVVEMNLGTQQSELHSKYGAPSIVYNVINFTGSTDAVNINSDGFAMNLIWFNKTFTRIPENLWMIFNPSLSCNKMLVNKVGEMVDIQNVVKNGTFHLHSVAPKGVVECQFGSKHTIQVQPIDAPLAGFVPQGMNEFTSFASPLDTVSNLSRGFGFVLFDTVWDTNYPQWYPFDSNDADAIYRFNVFLT
eukprot:415106_1